MADRIKHKLNILIFATLYFLITTSFASPAEKSFCLQHKLTGDVQYQCSKVHSENDLTFTYSCRNIYDEKEKPIRIENTEEWSIMESDTCRRNLALTQRDSKPRPPRCFVSSLNPN